MIELKVVNGIVTEDKKVIKFPRHWTHKVGDTIIKVTTQPYITSLYVAGNSLNGSNLFQSGIDYKDLKKVMNKLEKDKNISDIIYQDLTDYLSPEDLKLALS